MNKRILLSIATLALTATSASAQVALQSKDGDLSFRLIGRTHLDYGRYIPHSDGLDYGLKVNDTRLGFQANYGEKWNTKVEIAFSNKAISFRDVYTRYSFTQKQSITGGNQWQPFGAKPLGSVNYKFIENAGADNAITPSRKIGVSYDYTSNPFKATAGIFSDANVDNLSGNNGVNQGYSVAGKLIGRPILNDSTVLHFGVAGIYTDVANDYNFSYGQPENFEGRNLSKTPAAAASTVNINRGEAEILFIHKRFYFETHYLNAFANSVDGLDNLKAQGAYAQGSFLLIGKQQKYNKKAALANSNAKKNNLEVLARIDHLKIDEVGTTPEEKATDFTLGLNYFFNKNLNVRLNYSVAKVEQGENEFTNNAVQTRLQFSF